MHRKPWLNPWIVLRNQLINGKCRLNEKWRDFRFKGGTFFSIKWDQIINIRQRKSPQINKEFKRID